MSLHSSYSKLLLCTVSAARIRHPQRFSPVLRTSYLQCRTASILASLSDCPGAYNKKIRRGRGPSSGKGKTSGRGQKGQKAHGKVPARMQGGQTALSVVHGERGFDNAFALDLSVVNLDRVQSWINQGRIDPSNPITIKELVETRCIHGIKDGVKLLARNKDDLKTPINILVSRASASAIRAVESVGGTVITRYYTRASIKRLLKGESGSSCTPINVTLKARQSVDGPGNEISSDDFNYLLPDPSSRKDLEYYRDASKRGYLSHLVAKGHGPSLFYKSPAFNMSLFGTSPNDSVRAVDRKPRNSLFDDDLSIGPRDESKASSLSNENISESMSLIQKTQSVVEADSNAVISNLPFLTTVPESYDKIYELISKNSDNFKDKIKKETVKKILAESKLRPEDERSILEKVYQGAQPSALTRHEFYVLLALIGQAQVHEEITLEGLYERKNLPVPNLRRISRSSTSSSSFDEITSQTIAKPDPQRYLDQEGICGMSEAELWANSTANQNNHSLPSEINRVTHKVSNSEAQKSIRSSFNNTSEISRRSDGSFDREQESGPGPNRTWGSGNFRDSYKSTLKQNYGIDKPDGKISNNNLSQNTHHRTFDGAQGKDICPEETFVVTLLPEKEGIFLFQHHCYHVINVQKGHKVVRRFSDFVWLLDCLQKRFPFRQLPLLPPKRVGLNGNHLATDKTFIEKRRRGLSRFTNALTRHPVLSQEKLVIDFLSLITEFSVWRKQASTSIQDEFSGRILPPDLEDSLPLNLNDMFERSRAGIRRSAGIHTTLCVLMDRLIKRNEGFAAEQLRISRSLELLSDASEDTYSIVANDVPLLKRIFSNSIKHLNDSQALLVDEAKAWDLGVLEELKKQRDSLVSMRELFDRRDLYDTDNISFLERRIQKNEKKLADILEKPDETTKPGEVGK
ncbi:hypothetical protein EPUL_003740, partial [Erysiphe pulchra]